MKPSEVLDSAANILLRDGWHQQEYFKTPPGSSNAHGYEDRYKEANRTAPCCQAGAISRAVYGYACPPSDAFRKASAADLDAASRAEYFMSRKVGPPIDWNDQYGRTQEEVVEVMRAAAALARAEGE